jgi:hypothetical protein
VGPGGVGSTCQRPKVTITYVRESLGQWMGPSLSGCLDPQPWKPAGAGDRSTHAIDPYLQKTGSIPSSRRGRRIEGIDGGVNLERSSVESRRAT